MNDSIEQTMKAWRPSQPSRGLRSRIFAEEATSQVVDERPAFDLALLTRWLVPAVGCFLILAASVEPETQVRPEAGSLSLSRDRLAYSAMASANRDVNQKNSVPATSMERSFGQRAPFNNADSFAGSETNTLSK
jgi:hypothetical protein